MSDAPIDPSLGMKITLAAIAARFSKVKQISTESFFQEWSRNKTTNCDQSKSVSRSSSDNSTVSDWVVFDVREKYERDVSSIKGSIWIDSTQDTKTNIAFVKSVINEKVKAGTESFNNSVKKVVNVVAYCSLGYRSCELINNINESDFEDIPFTKVNFYNLKGSLFKWANERKPLVDANNVSTCYVHPYNMVWGVLLDENLKKWSCNL